jgi:hypothetical protein
MRLKMFDTPDGLVFRILRKIRPQLLEATHSDIETLIMGVNGIILTKGKDIIDFTKNDMVFPYAFATGMNRLSLGDKTWFDVDYYQIASLVGGGIDSTMKALFEAEGYSVKDKDGEEMESWDSLFSIDEEE